MDANAKKMIAYIQQLKTTIIDKYEDEEYQITTEWSGDLQVKKIAFKKPYDSQELENILPIIFERGANRAGKKFNILLSQFQDQLK
ncbi:MAG: hypothetical protein RI995_698 [Bacteroidota bacterium]|jgi:hypothetical protein